MDLPDVRKWLSEELDLCETPIEASEYDVVRYNPGLSLGINKIPYNLGAGSPETAKGVPELLPSYHRDQSIVGNMEHLNLEKTEVCCLRLPRIFSFLKLSI
ncbi:hypothetical protein B0H34DRAFT_681940 [Crassisporium funariophilum]|nr:hypothetical protein B0H34DRAFT_681940 [Crassisporium funariophilum]